MNTPPKINKAVPPFAYFGGKTTLAPKIAALFPPHEHYVEPFCGSLAVLLAKPATRYETVNDIDEGLVTFWRVLRERPRDLARVCALTPHSRVEHAQSYLPVDGDELEVARRVWVNLSQGRAGIRRATGWRHYVKPVGTAPMADYLDGYLDRMYGCAERLRRVSLECRPALDLIERYGREPGVVLSGYASELYDSLFGDWERVEFSTMTGQGGSNQARTEVLWSNGPLAAEHLFSETAGVSL